MILPRSNYYNILQSFLLPDDILRFSIKYVIIKNFFTALF